MAGKRGKSVTGNAVGVWQMSVGEVCDSGGVAGRVAEKVCHQGV